MIRTYSQLRLVTLRDDGTTHVEHGAHNINGESDRSYYIDKWTRLMAEYPYLHLAIQERQVTQTFTSWDTAVDRPKQTLF